MRVEKTVLVTGGPVSRGHEAWAAPDPAPGLRPPDPTLELTGGRPGGDQTAGLSPVDTAGQSLQSLQWSQASEVPAGQLAPPLSLVEITVGDPLSLLPSAGQRTGDLQILHILAVQTLPSHRQSGQHTASHRVQSQGKPGLDSLCKYL